jgi:two-component system OmpR family sensor kinase
MSSLRRIIGIRTTVMLAMVGIAAAASSFGFVTHEMNKFLDAQLQAIAINVGPGDRSQPGPLLDSESEDQLVVRIWDRTAELVYQSGPEIDIPWEAKPGLSDATAAGQDWRVYRWSHARQDIQVGQTWSARHEIAVHAATGAAIPLLLAVPLAWLVVGWSISRATRGLQRLSIDVAARRRSGGSGAFDPGDRQARHTAPGGAGSATTLCRRRRT